MMELQELLRLLAEHGVAFIVIGGAAAVIHGSSRLTQDLDPVYQRTPENIAHLVQALPGQSLRLHGTPPGSAFHWPWATERSGLNCTIAEARRKGPL